MGGLALNVLNQKVLLVLCREEVSSREKVEEDRTKAENVCLIAVPRLLEDFGSHITWRPALMLDQFVIGSEGSEPEVGDPYLIILFLLYPLDKNIIELNVPVDYFLLLEEVQGK